MSFKERKLVIVDNTALGKWIFQKVKELSDAEPKALTQYALALLKKDLNIADLQSSCVSLLDVFLKPNTEKFVNELFVTISSNSYLNANNCLATTASEDVPEDLKSVHTIDESIKPPIKQKPPREVTTTSSEALPLEDISSHKPSVVQKHSSRDLSHRRKHQGRSRSPVSRQRRGGHRRRRSQSSSNSRSRSSSPHQLSSSVRVVEGRNLKGLNSTRRPSNRLRCRDYDEKGFCLKGDQCEFDHGSDAVVMSSDGAALAPGVSRTNLAGQWRDRLGPTNFLTEAVAASTSEWNVPSYQPSPVVKINDKARAISNVIPIVVPNGKSQRNNRQPISLQGDEPQNMSAAYEPSSFTEKKEYIPLPNEDTRALANYIETFKLLAGNVAVPQPLIPGLGDYTAQQGLTTDMLRARRNFHQMQQGNRFQPYPQPNRGGFHRGGTGGVGGGRFRNNEAREQNCVVAYKIPPGKANVGDINSCFKEFGTITKIELCFNNQPDSALIYFAHEFEAERAYRHTGLFFSSPEVVVKSFRLMTNALGNNRGRGRGRGLLGQKGNFSQRQNWANDGEDQVFSEDRKDDKNSDEELMNPRYRHSENANPDRKRTFSSDATKGNRFEEEEQRRREMEKEAALKERQEQIALLSKAKEDQRKNIILSLTNIAELLFSKLDAEANATKKQKLQDTIFEVNNYLELMESNTNIKTEDLFKRIPDFINRVKLIHQLNMPPFVNVSLVREQQVSVTNVSPVTAAEKKAIRKLDTRSRDVYVIGLADDKPDDVQSFLSLLERSNLTVETHKMCHSEDSIATLVIRFTTRQEAENAVRGIKTFHGKPINLSFSPPLGISDNVFADSEKVGSEDTAGKLLSSFPMESNSLQMVVHLEDGHDEMDDTDEEETERSWRR